jgi:mono/diheme cytochrome c family protein
MKGLTTLFLFVTMLVSLETNSTRFVNTGHGVAAQQPPETTGANELGRRIFVSRCAKCHDEDAAKKLPDGTSLVQRLAESKDPDALANTRLKQMSEEDRQAVHRYLNELVKRYRSRKSTLQPAMRRQPKHILSSSFN